MAKPMVMLVPTATLTGLGIVVESWVAPARACTDPSAATPVKAERSSVPMGEGAEEKRETDARRVTGIRCRKVIRSSEGRLSQTKCL